MIIIIGTIVTSYTINSIYRGFKTNGVTDSDVTEVVTKQIKEVSKRK